MRGNRDLQFEKAKIQIDLVNSFRSQAVSWLSVPVESDFFVQEMFEHNVTLKGIKICGFPDNAIALSPTALLSLRKLNF